MTALWLFTLAGAYVLAGAYAFVAMWRRFGKWGPHDFGDLCFIHALSVLWPLWLAVHAVIEFRHKLSQWRARK